MNQSENGYMGEIFSLKELQQLSDKIYANTQDDDLEECLRQIDLFLLKQISLKSFSDKKKDFQKIAEEKRFSIRVPSNLTKVDCFLRSFLRSNDIVVEGTTKSRRPKNKSEAENYKLTAYLFHKVEVIYRDRSDDIGSSLHAHQAESASV